MLRQVQAIEVTKMNTKSQHDGLIYASTVLLGLIIAGPSSANVTVEPSSQPTATLAPYVLKDANLEAGPTRAYRPWFESGAWMGDLIEYTISADGQRTTDVPVGVYPAREGEENWSARSMFPERDRDADLALESWAHRDYWKDRVLFTASEEGERIEFWWDRLSDDQKERIDSITFNSEDTNQDDPEASDLLNFIRGDRSQERDQEGGRFRLRYSLMAAVINSRPTYLPTDGGGLVLVGANGGILHAFDANTGEEQFGYIPSMLFGKLDRLTYVPYRHTYYVDGELRGRSLPDGNGTKHIVTGGLGAGGKGIFALDVTDPTNPDIVFEISETDADIGHVHGRPSIARLPNGNWYVVTGNGYLSGSETAKLYLIPLNGGAPSTILANVATGNGLSAPALVDNTGNGRVDYAYAGDLRGNLWRFSFANGTATRLFSDPAGNPITVEPDIARHPTGAGVMVYFGTGSLLSSSDLENTAEQAVYGIWDRFGSTGFPISADRLITQELVTLNNTWEGQQRTVRLIQEDEIPEWGGNTPDLGWRVALPDSGERLIGSPQIRGGRLQFVSLNPSQRDEDGSPYNESWMIQLEIASGGSPQRALFDLNRDEVLSEEDGLDVDDEIRFPVGLRLGPGNISQPAFARVIQDIDAVFINGLLLPGPEELGQAHLVFGGDINVTTDSPLGPKVNPHDTDPDYPDDGRKTETDPHARGPMNQYLVQDGLGDRLDGHHFAYDKVHGVNYVDYFDLEPRRGEFSLMPSLAPYRVLPELNRVTEVNGLDDDQKFIVVLANADLSKGAELQIGCRTWPVYEYQEMITRQLLEGRAPEDLRDERHGGGLIFSLDEILKDSGHACTQGREPTLRISMTDRVGKDGVLQGTLPGCVNNSHHVNGDLKSNNTHPHITSNNEGRGYRWRNAALTMQLLAVGDGGAQQY